MSRNTGNLLRPRLRTDTLSFLPQLAKASYIVEYKVETQKLNFRERNQGVTWQSLRMSNSATWELVEGWRDHRVPRSSALLIPVDTKLISSDGLPQDSGPRAERCEAGETLQHSASDAGWRAW